MYNNMFDIIMIIHHLFSFAKVRVGGRVLTRMYLLIIHTSRLFFFTHLQCQEDENYPFSNIFKFGLNILLFLFRLDGIYKN